jgi:hypothetical protein
MHLDDAKVPVIVLTGSNSIPDRLWLTCAALHSGHHQRASRVFQTTETPMKFVLQPWQLMLVILGSWVNRQQQEVIEYLRNENAVLKEKFGKNRILLTDEQRRRLAVKGKILGRKQLEQVGTLFTPDTILRWHR